MGGKYKNKSTLAKFRFHFTRTRNIFPPLVAMVPQMRSTSILMTNARVPTVRCRLPSCCR